MSMNRLRGSHTALWEQMTPGDWIRTVETRGEATVTIEGIITSISDETNGKFVTIGHYLAGMRPTIPAKPTEGKPIIRALARDTTMSDSERATYANSIANGYKPTTPTPPPAPTGTEYTDVPLFT